MDTETRHRDYGFVLGLLTGTVVGAGLAALLAPRAAAEVRTRLSNAAGEVARRGNGLRDDVADSVVRGAHEVERMATAAKSGRH